MKATERMSDATWAFRQALNNILDNDRSQKSVIVFPWTSSVGLDPGTRVWGDQWEAIRQIMLDIQNKGVIIVLSAGNQADHSPQMNTLPAIFDYPEIPPLSSSHLVLAAGAVTKSGVIASFSQGKNQDVFWAPGVDIRCAGPSDQQSADGTSFSAPLVGNSVISD